MSWPPEQDLGFFIRTVYADQKSGVLRQSLPPVQRNLYFREGRLVFAHSNVKGEKLGQMLIEDGVIDSEQELKILLEAKGEKRLGEFLLNQGMVAPDELQRILERQMQDIFQAVWFHDGPVQWEDRDMPIYQELQLPLALGPLIEVTVLNDPHPERYRDRLPPSDWWLTLSDRALIERTQMDSEDNLLKSQLTHARQVGQLMESLQLEPHEIARRLYLALLFGYIIAHPADKFSGAAKGLFSLSMPDINPLPPNWETFAERIDKMSAWEAFALPQEANLGQINKRYYQLCDWLHPLYYNPRLDDDSRRKLKKLIDRISEYYDELKTHALARDSRHLQVVARETPKEPVTPEEKLQRIQLEIERGQFFRAQQLIRQYEQELEHLPEFQYCKGVVFSLQKETWAQAEAAFKKALLLDPGNVDFLMELANFYNTTGLRIKAFNILRQVLAKDPNNFRARELLRLYKKQEERTP